MIDCFDPCFDAQFFFLSRISFTNINDFQDSIGKGEAISLIPLQHFYPLHRHSDISRAITAESSPLHIASSRTRTGNWERKSLTIKLRVLPTTKLCALKKQRVKKFDIPMSQTCLKMQIKSVLSIKIFLCNFQPALTCSKSTIETLEKCVKFVQS